MKTWTRPKIKVQKFVPNYCVSACLMFTDFYADEAWVDDSQRSEKFIWDDPDIYKTDWPATAPDGKTYIKNSSSDYVGYIGEWDCYKRNGLSNDLPQIGVYENRKFDDYEGLQVIEKGDHNIYRQFYLVTTTSGQILARTKYENAS